MSLDQIKSAGYAILPNLVDEALVDELRTATDLAYQACREIQVRNGIEANTDGTVHHLLAFEGPFLQFLDHLFCHEIIANFFDAPYILNTFGGVINLPGTSSYVANIHRDIRTFYNLPMMINMLVMLDPFTVENGATYLLPGSHLVPEKPRRAEFLKNAVRATGGPGTILLFDSLLWHSAGLNETDCPRRALTLAFTRPFQKQQLDYPRMLGYDRINNFGAELRQILGYNSRVPTSLDEWYQPPGSRFYKPGQG